VIKTGKKVHVDSYSRTDGTHVRAYTRYDPRNKHFDSMRELPPEDDKPSFLSDGVEEEESESTESSEKETKTTKQASSKKGESNESD